MKLVSVGLILLILVCLLQLKLDFPDEVLTSISGFYGPMSSGGPVVIRSLTFESNQAKYGPYGFQQGTHFSFPMTGGRIVGFHGRYGWYLDSVGVYLKALQKPDMSNSLLPSQTGYNVVQGTVGKGYDIVLAVREKEDNNRVLWNSFSRQSSDTNEFTIVEKQSTASILLNMLTNFSFNQEMCLNYIAAGCQLSEL